MAYHHNDDLKFSQLYNLYTPSMLCLAKKIMRDNGDAEDIVQISMLKVMNILPQIDIVDSPKTKALLNTITKNTAIDCYRKRQRNPLLSFNSELSALCITTTSPEDIYFNADYYQNIACQMQALPVIYQATLHLRCFKGLSTKETALILGVSEPVVNTRLIRARRLLNSLLVEKSP